jgi:hypothetical protein
MIKDPLSKLYKHMTSKELAALAFANLTNNDPLEEARISDAVPRHTYICLDATFRQHLDSIFNMACCWSIQYWQCQTRKMAANGVLLAHLHDKTATDQLAKDDDIVELFAQQIAALELALDEVCHEYHIDINAVKQLAGITTTGTTRQRPPDANYLKRIKGEMVAILNGDKEHKTINN